MRVLLATDLSSAAENAAKLVAAVRWPPASTIRVLGVLEPVTSLVPAGGPSIPTPSTEDADAEVYLRSLARSFEAPTRSVGAAVRVGRPATEIVGVAEQFRADLVVVGSRGRGPFISTLLGSVAAEVVDHAPCPVLVARRSGIEHGIVVGDDGSPEARRAVDLLGAWSFLHGVAVTIVSVIDVPPLLMADGGLAADLAAFQHYGDALAGARRAAEETVARAVARLEPAEVRATAQTREGDAAGELVAAARETRADLVVVGSRGLTGVRRLLLGSVARNVLFHAPCSVLVVHGRA